jgi:hypothetical protein
MSELANLNDTILTMRDVFVSVLDSIVDADAKLKRTNFANFESFATNNEISVKEKLTGILFKDYCQITTLDGKEKYIIFDSNRNIMVKDSDNQLTVSKYYDTILLTHNTYTCNEYTYIFNNIYSYNGKKNNETTNSEMLIIHLTKKYTRKIIKVIDTNQNITSYNISTTGLDSPIDFYLYVDNNLSMSYKVNSQQTGTNTTQTIAFPTDADKIFINTDQFKNISYVSLKNLNPSIEEYSNFFDSNNNINLPLVEMKFLHDPITDLEVTIKSTLKTAYYDDKEIINNPDGTITEKSIQKAIPLVAFMDTNNLIIDNASVEFDISIDYMSKTKSNLRNTSGVVENSFNVEGSSFIGVEGTYKGSSGYSYNGNWNSNNNYNTTATGNSSNRSGVTSSTNRTSGSSNYRSTNTARGTSSYNSAYTTNASYLGMYDSNQVVAACNMSASSDTISEVKEFKPKVKAVVNLRSVSNPGIQLLRENVISKFVTKK